MRTLISAKGETSDAFSIKQAFSWDTFRGAITNTPSSREQVKQERERGRERGGGEMERKRERERETATQNPLESFVNINCSCAL